MGNEKTPFTQLVFSKATNLSNQTIDKKTANNSLNAEGSLNLVRVQRESNNENNGGQIKLNLVASKKAGS